MSYGANVKFGLARQTAGATPVTLSTSFHALPLLSEDVGLEKDELISQNLTGRFDQGAAYDGVGRVNGTIEFELTPRNIGPILTATITHSPVTATSGSVMTRTFFPNTVDFSTLLVKAPMTIYKQYADSNSAEQYFDCQFGQLELMLSQGQFVKGRATVIGGARTLTGVGSTTILPDAADVGRLFPWNVASLSYGGAALAQASDITVAVNENIDALYCIDGTLAPNKYTRSGFREVTVNGTFYMSDRTVFNNFINGTQARLLVTLMNTRAAIQSGYYDQLTIDVPQLKITQCKPGASGPGELSVSFTGRGVLDANSGYTIAYTLLNTYAAGY